MYDYEIWSRLTPPRSVLLLESELHHENVTSN